MKLKYTLLLLTMLVITSLAEAQIKEGTVLPGGGIRYLNQQSENAQTGDKLKYNIWSIAPGAGYAIKDNLVLGVELSYGHQKNENYSTYNRNKISNMGGAVFLRKYWNISSKFYAFAHTEVSYSRRIEGLYDKSTGEKLSKTKRSGGAATLIPGISYAVSRKVQLESSFASILNITYSKMNSQTISPSYPAYNTSEKSFNLSGGFDNGQYFSLGIRFLLSK